MRNGAGAACHDSRAVGRATTTTLAHFSVLSTLNTSIIGKQVGGLVEIKVITQQLIVMVVAEERAEVVCVVI